MPRRFIKKYIPNEQILKNNKYLQIFGKHILAPNLWHLNKRSVSGAFSIGLFCAFIPVPFQMILAAAAALLIKVNLPVSAALVWITNPLTMPAIFYFSYLVGTWTLGAPVTNIEFSLTIDWLQNELSVIWQPFLLGCLICGISAAVMGNILVRIIWRYLVLQNWRKRKDDRLSNPK